MLDTIKRESGAVIFVLRGHPMVFSEDQKESHPLAFRIAPPPQVCDSSIADTLGPSCIEVELISNQVAWMSPFHKSHNQSRSVEG